MRMTMISVRYQSETSNNVYFHYYIHLKHIKCGPKGESQVQNRYMECENIFAHYRISDRFQATNDLKGLTYSSTHRSYITSQYSLSSQSRSLNKYDKMTKICKQYHISMHIFSRRILEGHLIDCIVHTAHFCQGMQIQHLDPLICHSQHQNIIQITRKVNQLLLIPESFIAFRDILAVSQA